MIRETAREQFCCTFSISVNTICVYEGISEHLCACLKHTNTEARCQMAYCSFPYTAFFLNLGKLVEEVQMNDQISAEKRQKRVREAVSHFSFLCAFKKFLLGTDLEN